MALQAGNRLGQYEILEQIGSGGMGEVYRANDGRLKRAVAIKVLPDDLARDAERLARFEREAHLLASLNHPNIGAIYGMEEAEGKRCLVLELIEGRSLSARNEEGPVPVKETLRIGLQIAAALEAAHEKGIVHRDLKPGNIMITPDGVAKVLDFGLSKAVEGDGSESSADLSLSPTLTAMATRAGVILGTAAYMSPEQARGKRVDRRADIWAFGVVICEMLTGKRLFAADEVSDTLAEVLKTEPDWKLLPPDVPQSIRTLLSRCLDKDPRRRLRDIGEARIAIDDVLAGRVSVESGAPAEAGRGLRPAVLGAAVAVTAVVAAAGAWLAKPAPSSGDVAPTRFEIPVEDLDWGPAFAISPDGRSVLFSAGGRLRVRRLDMLEAREIPGIEGAMLPFWSSDGSSAGFVAGGKMRKVALTGGETTVISDLPDPIVRGAGASWGSGDRIVFSGGGGSIWEIPARGGDARVLLEADDALDEDHFHEPSWLPDERGVLFTIHRLNGGTDTVALLRSDGIREELVRHEGRSVWHPFYSPSGHILYAREGSNGGIWALPFSLSAMEVTGEPFLAVPGGAWPSVSTDGTLVSSFGSVSSIRQPVWVDRTGEIGEAVGQPQQDMIFVRLSPDGGKIAVSSREEDNFDIWVHDVRRGTRTRLTFSERGEYNPSWSPEGDRIAHSFDSALEIRASDGTGEPLDLGHGESATFSPDGKLIVYSDQGDLHYRKIGGEEEPVRLLATDAWEGNPAVSPDGRFIAYASDESGVSEVYLKTFPAGEGKWQVSTSGGNHPVWSKDGGELFYRASDSLMSVQVDSAGGTPTLDNPVRLFSTEGTDLLLAPRTFDVAADGRILATRRVGEAQEKINITVTLNWFAEFRR